MSSPNDYILITGSLNLDDGSNASNEKVLEEDEEASLQALKGQGISILDDDKSLSPSRDTENFQATAEPRDQLSRELLDQGGVEIIQGEEEEDSY